MMMGKPKLDVWQGVEVEPDNPHVFWSAAEDGIVRQYDTRLSANSQKAWESSNCLLSVKATGPGSSNRSVELKGISLNKVCLLPFKRQLPFCVTFRPSQNSSSQTFPKL